jgi:MFS family permease
MASPTSSLGDDFEKDVGFEKTRSSHEDPRLTQQQQDLIEASEPPFTEHVQSDGGDLEKVTSAKPSVTNIKHVPNGGTTAWLQVLGSFFIYWNAWGIVNTFGTYQTFYETDLLSASSPSDISWIGSVQAFLLMVVSALGGPLYDAGYVHHLLIGGSVLAVLGQMMLSLCTTYWQVFLAQGICIGIGTGAMFVPGVAILSTYFSTKIATATGLAAAGSSLGGTIYPIVFHQLQPKIGFAWATRVLGFIMLATLIVSNCVLKVRVLPEGRRRFLDLTAFKELPYVLFVAGNTMAFLGLYNPFFYVQSYVIESGIAGPGLAFYMLSIINASSTFGRVRTLYLICSQETFVLTSIRSSQDTQPTG